MTQMTGSRLFAEMLRDYEVSHVFYIPAIMLGAIAEMEKMGIKRIMTHGEKSAAYMADGYARASRKPGICMSQQIGGSNLAAGLRDAYMASAPLIAITGGPPTHAHYKNGYQEVEDMSQFDSVTKFNARVEDISRIPDLLRQAFREATSGSPGPVHLEIRGPHGQIANAQADLNPMVEKRYVKTPPFRPMVDQAQIDEVLSFIKQYKKPIIVAGGGVIASGAEGQLKAFAEQLQIPVATSLNGKASMPDNHPLSVGVVGNYSRECANRAVCEADLVFFIGSKTGGQTTVDWAVPQTGTAVIQLDINAVELGRNYPNSMSLNGDAKAILQQLTTTAQQEKGADFSAWLSHTQGLVSEWRKHFEPLLKSNATPIRPERICQEISNALPADGVVVSDTGHSGMWTGAMIQLNQPGQSYVRCAGSMGWGFPGAMGVKCALPDQAVVCFTGDGAFYYHIAELETAARFNINLVVVVNNNGALNQEIPLWDSAYGSKEAAAQADPNPLWKFEPINFAELAESLGCVGIRVTDPNELQGALKKAFSLNAPVVIDVVSDINAFAKKAWTPKDTYGY
ncbi:thiamine pyrophosphate-binding protein [Polynucleobacter sp. Latsch14-2]|jgi:acetolactate synthase-1/2/3 large subunit|uniref:thiamine pyrophosphate-binding protein n=1 Tax=Polynucleobacter sp. Latsch14-2 TaxID=2576920 RepID=UPI001C0E69AC|nr:thiamine pyrophosphate-binding protein [Polynucleobacter sp. Latsch14-2]MBU3614225.1 thiamine pyrophosphate-binding protein [Polynucleobacter sp. Latsch14-2]